MSKSNAFENDFLKLIFNAVPIANLADDASTGPLTELWVSLHTANPDEGGNQSSNEAAYTPYARVSVARDSGGWQVSGNTVTPVADIDFATCSDNAGSPITYLGIGTDASGPGKLLMSGTIAPSITMAVGVMPKIKNTSTIVED